MRTVALIHPSLNRYGGAEKMCLEMLTTLKNAGYTVHLYTLDKPRWEDIEKNWGIKNRPDHEEHQVEGILDPSSSYMWLLTAIRYIWMLFKAQMEDYLTINNYGEAFPLVSDVSVMHSKPLITIEHGNPYKVPFWEFVQPAYVWLHRFMASRYPTKIIVANSNYNAGIIRKKLGRIPITLHPFIEPINYGREAKTGQILVVSRLTSAKNLEIIPEVLRYSRGTRCSLAGRTNRGTPSLLKAIRNDLRMDVYPNPRRSEIMNLMRSSSIYLSTQPNEAFGMAVLEAMSAGCVPVVYRDGGPWIDVLEETDGEVGYSYTTGMEAADKIDLILSDEFLRERLRVNAVKRVNYFSRERFEEKFMEIVKSVPKRERRKDRLARAYRWIVRIRTRINSEIDRLLGDF
ncbi:MAG: glycosyltransferase family 4 protein [Candidatus Bathyarchaeota archaeon]|nr:glycosyltransferase family 4 protein [Candidatus Bathyarchaeota archaeon]